MRICAGPCKPAPSPRRSFPTDSSLARTATRTSCQNYFHTSIQDFETQVKKEIEINRLEAMVTGGITVSDQDVRDAYRQQGTKIKFDYAVINSEDLRKQINPTDAELQAFFKQNAARYKDAIPETRKLAYIALNQTDVPGGAPAGHQTSRCSSTTRRIKRTSRCPTK